MAIATESDEEMIQKDQNLVDHCPWDVMPALQGQPLNVHKFGTGSKHPLSLRIKRRQERIKRRQERIKRRQEISESSIKEISESSIKEIITECLRKEMKQRQERMKQRQETSESSIIQVHLILLDSILKKEEIIKSKLKTKQQKETFQEIPDVIKQESNISEQLSKFDRNQNSLIFKKMNLYSDISLSEVTDMSSGSMNQFGMAFLEIFVNLLQTDRPNLVLKRFWDRPNELDIKQLLNQVKAKNKQLSDISILLNKMLDIVKSWLFPSIICTCTLLLCLFLSSCILKGHKSAILKKYLVLKYAYHNVILYLLWCSGDVELHPGPTFKKIRRLADSQKERNWIHDMCSILLKILLGLDVSTKTDGIWKDKPKGWPENQLFYDPKNKPKDQICNSETDIELLENLIKCCRSSSKEIPKEYQNEVNAWKEPGGDKKKLFDLFIIRTEFCSLSKVVLELSCFCKFMQSHGFEVTFSSLQTGSEPTKHVNDIVRDLIVTLCKLAKNLNPVEKHDGIWKEPPEGWNQDNKFFNPCNAGKRSSKNEDQNLLSNLIDYCEEKKITIPEDLISIIDAWKNDTSNLSKFYTIWANCLQIQHSLEYLEIEELLHQPLVQQKLDALGIHKLQSDRPLKRRGDGKDKTISKRQALETRDKQLVASSSQAKPTTDTKVVDEPVDSQGLSTNTDVFLDISNQHTPSFQANEMPDSRIEEQTFEPFQGTPIIKDVFMGSPLTFPTYSASSTIPQDMFISSTIDNPLDEVEVCSDFEQLLPIHEKLFPLQI